MTMVALAVKRKAKTKTVLILIIMVPAAELTSLPTTFNFPACKDN